MNAREAAARIWGLAGGDPAALDWLDLSGPAVVLPTSFKVAAAAQATIGAAGLAAAEAWRARTGRRQRVAVDSRNASCEFRSERYLEVAGQIRGEYVNAAHGLHPCRDGRIVRIHAAAANHREVALRVLGGVANEAGTIQAATRRWDAFELESAIYAAGGVCTALRSPEEWAATGHGQAVAGLAPLSIEKIGEAPPRPLPEGPRPLSGIRVIDITRVIAAPVAARTMAAHGAEVLHLQSPNIPSQDGMERDTGRGKRNAFLDLKRQPGRETLSGLCRDADVFLQGFRPGAIAALGFGPEEVARLRPGIVYASLSAWGHLGPWSGRRGFDSLVQTASGYNHEEGIAGGGGPLELPCQALDHASGYLLALGTIMARLRQAREGGSWLVRVALAGTGRWLWSLGREADGFARPDLAFADIQDLIERRDDTVWGSYGFVRHAARLSETPARWDRPAVPPGTHEPAWEPAPTSP